MRWTILIMLVFTVSSFAVRAVDISASDDSQLEQRAKNRLYPGGHDEEPLQVQSQLSPVRRKVQPAQEPVEAPDETPEPSGND